MTTRFLARLTSTPRPLSTASAVSQINRLPESASMLCLILYFGLQLWWYNGQPPVTFYTGPYGSNTDQNCDCFYSALGKRPVQYWKSFSLTLLSRQAEGISLIQHDCGSSFKTHTHNSSNLKGKNTWGTFIFPLGCSCKTYNSVIINCQNLLCQ